MKKLLITGASGFLGGHIFSRAHSVFQCLGTYNTYPTGNDIPNWRNIDLCNFFDVFELLSEFQPEIIIHAAANSNLDECEKNPQKAQGANVEATAHLVSISKQFNARFIHVSTDMVFDGAGSLYQEDDETKPISVYGLTKLQAESAVQQIENAVIVRSALIYGRPAISGSCFSMWVESRLNAGKSVPLYVDQYRSPILVDNLAEILLELCESDFTGILHAGGSNRIDRFTFGKQMCDRVGFDPDLLDPVFMDDHAHTAARPRDVSLNINKAMSILKTRLLSTEEGLDRMS